MTTAGHPPFVGREHEIERLEQVWEAVQRGERQVVFLGGEPGSGKSRLVAEVAKGLHAQDVAVLLGSSSPDLGRPYEAMVEVLDHLLRGTTPGSLSDVIPDSAGELLRLTPNVGVHRPDLASPRQAAKEYRQELFVAYIDLIRAIATDRPVAIVLEDMHWSSPPTRLLMARMIESIHDQPLLVLATMRNTAPDRSVDLSHTIADLYRLPGVSRVDLTGLRLEDVEDYLRMAVGRAEPRLRETAALLQDQTGGNPFFLREVWREMAASGGLRSVRSKQPPIPHSVRDMLERRIRMFGPSGRTVLEYAAVLGQVFDAANLLDAVEGSREQAFQSLDQAIEAGLIAPIGPGCYAFQHALIRQALLEGLSPSKSARTHARLAELLSDRYPADPTLAPVLARLFDGARSLGYRDKTSFFLSRAAESAGNSLAHEEAADLWERAARSAGGDQRNREELLLAAARSHLLAGDFSEARRIYREVNASDDAESAVRAAIGFEEATWRPGVLGDEAKRILEASMDRIDPDPTNPLYVSASIAWSRAHNFTGDLDTGGRLVSDALAMARELGDDALIADALVSGLLRTMTGPRTDEATLEMAMELRGIAIRSGDHDRLATSGTPRACDGYIRSNRDGWIEGRADVRLAADKTGQPFWRWVDGCFEHIQQFLTGGFDAAAATAIRINELGYSLGTDDTEGPFGMQMYMVRRESGGLNSTRSLISGDPSRDGTWTPGLLSLYTELGMKDSVRSLMARSLGLTRTVDSREAVYPAVIAFMTEAAVYLGDGDVIRSLLPHMEAFDGSNLLAGPGVAAFGSANTYLGMMHAVLGEFERAEHHFRQGLGMDVAIGSIVNQAWTQAQYAALLEKTGRSDLAMEYRSRARQLAEPIGQERVLRIVGRSADDLPDGLTQREVEVLRLLVEGASNKDIGDRLFISHNTAANHVRSILTKTGRPNRTAAAHYAREHGLA